MEVFLDGNGVWEYTQIDIPKLAASDAQALAQWKKDIVQSRRIILEGVRDHVVYNLHGKETPLEMWKTLMDLFKNSNDAKKFSLRDKLSI